MDWEIYIYLDPPERLPSRRCYVGKTLAGQAGSVRLLHHSGCYNSYMPSDRWLHHLKSAGLRPVVCVVETGDGDDEWQDAEKRWIGRIKEVAGGDCLNISPGGEGFSGPKSPAHKKSLRENLAMLASRQKTQAQLEAFRATILEPKAKAATERIAGLPDRRCVECSCDIRHMQSARVRCDDCAHLYHQSKAGKDPLAYMTAEERAAWKEKIGASNRGRKHSAEWRANMSRANSGSGNPFFGRKHTAESLERISQASRGRPGRGKIDETQEQRNERLAKNRRDARKQRRVAEGWFRKRCINCSAAFEPYRKNQKRCQSCCGGSSPEVAFAKHSTAAKKRWGNDKVSWGKVDKSQSQGSLDA